MPVSIEELPPGEVDQLKELWLQLLRHHGTVSPAPLELIREPESWERRRKLYAKWLHDPEAFTLMARADGRPAGYAVVTIEAGDRMGDTWRTGDRVAELQTLVVDPEQRGAGVGAALMDELERRLRERGLRDMVIGVAARNGGALRFYERRGAVPYLTTLYQRL